MVSFLKNIFIFDAGLHQTTIYYMRQRLLFSILLSIFALWAEVSAQVFVTNLNPAVYIDSLIRGESICFSNVQFGGNPEAIGYFEVNNPDSTTLGFNKGIVMSTGIAADVFGANEFDNSFTGGLDNLPELTAAVPPDCGTIEDGVLLQFDFVTQGSMVEFQYVFASDEYNTYVCTQFNDAFAFLISGPGIVGQQNLALTPSGDPITISTVNDGTYNGTPTGGGPCVTTNSASFNDQVDPNDPASIAAMSVQFNGFTNVLTARADNLIPCQTYTLKMMIADYCDASLSSGVFLAANSFSGGPVVLEPTFPDGVVDGVIYESCEPVVLEFTRANPDPFPVTIPFTIGGTAIPDVDYEEMPDFITIDPGETTVNLTINAFLDDDDTEGTETIIISYQPFCGCPDIRTEIIFLQDKPVIVADAGPDLITCSGVPVLLGTPPLPNYQYEWDPPEGLNFTNIARPSALVSNIAGENSFFEFRLRSRIGGCEAFDTVMVEVKPQPIAFYEPPADKCYLGNSFDFEGDGIFNTNLLTYLWDFGANANPPLSADPNPQEVVFNATGTIEVKLQVIDDGCASEVFTDAITVHAMPVANFVPSETVVCTPAVIQFTDLSTNTDPLQWFWDFGNGNTSTLQNPIQVYGDPGRYTVGLKVKSIYGCENEYAIPGLINVNASPKAGFDISPGDVLQLHNPKLTINSVAQNANECYYVVLSANTLPDTVFTFDIQYTFPDTGNYRVGQILRNTSGCYDSTWVNIRVDPGYKLFVPLSFTPNGDGINDYFTFSGEDINVSEIVIYNRWGNVVYTSYDLGNGWDGSYKLSDEPVPDGVYFYEVKTKDPYDNFNTQKGYLFLVR